MSSKIVEITACILARNEEKRIEDALKSLQGWTDQIIVIDNESEDETVSIARSYGAQILTAPCSANFDAARNQAIEAAKGAWIFYLDADERVPARLGEALLRLIRTKGSEFAALSIPFKHFFCGKWIEHSGWWPGYTRPQLLKKGAFRYNNRLHSGIEVQGPTLFFPADDPQLAILHYSYNDLNHYLTKLNNYTDGEAENLREDSQSHTWQAQLAHFVQDWQLYYERGRADLDGMHGFVLAFMSGFYRFASRAKLWDLRRKQGELIGQDAVPASLREMLEFMAQVTQEGASRWLTPSHQSHPSQRAYIPAEWLAPEVGVFPDRPESYPRTTAKITACILARNEANRIEKALKSLQGWTHQIIVIDNESEDATVEIARPYADLLLTAPRAQNFDAARNVALDHATGDWIFFLDADERVPPQLARALLRLVEERGEQFEGVYLPSRNYVCGKWLQSPVWWPGYSRPYLLKKGRFRYGERLHSGVQVQGQALYFPADDPDMAVVHESVADIAFYIAKLNNYTDAEAENLYAAGCSDSWQAMLADFTHDWQVHYDELSAHQDGMRGFIFAFLCSFYRFASRAKLWDLRRKQGETTGLEPVPASLREMIEFMAQVTQEGADRWLRPPPALPKGPVPLIWAAPLYDPSGYADEARNFVLALAEAGEPFAVAPVIWNAEAAVLPDETRRLLETHTVPRDTAAIIFVSQSTPPLNRPSPSALVSVARTMFETDGLLPGWEQILNEMDRIWVPSEFNRESFASAGVDPRKIAVIPGCIDATPFAEPVDPWPVPGGEDFKFLAVFDWTRHKGWDVLLEAFAREFGDTSQVGLVLKVWSSNNYTLEDMYAQADAHLQRHLQKTLKDFPNIHLWQERIPSQDMPRLYKAVNAFVLATRGEGWCRPLMEAMATGLPTIATAWSGLVAFHNARVGYPVKYTLVPVSQEGMREIPIYSGQRWAEPDIVSLQQRLRQVVQNPEAAQKKGETAQKSIQQHFSRIAIARILQQEITLCRQLAEQKRRALQSASPAQEATPALPTEPPRTPSPVGDDQGTGGSGLPASGPSVAPSPPERQERASLVAANPVPLDAYAAVDFQAALGRPLRVCWEGDQTVLSSLAHVNRELGLELSHAPDMELSLHQVVTPWHTLTAEGWPRFASLFQRQEAALSGPPDVTVRHFFPPDWKRPAEGKLVVMQPWETSHLPFQEWLEGAKNLADEVWAHTRFVRDVYVRSGVPAEKIHLVPHGVRTEIFQPEGPRYPLPTRKSVRFLFVGGAIPRKGADLLLAAYLNAFTRQDDVCLIVKDMGSRTFYQGMTLAEQFRRIQADSTQPEVLYLDNEFSETDLAALYRSCTCVALPYRGEGFGLPPLEGMACGLPVIVTAGGATEDYVDDVVALRVPSRRRARKDLPSIAKWFGVDAWELEPDLNYLVDALRWVRDNPERARERGAEGRERVLAGWTWERAAGMIRERLHALCVPSSAASTRRATLWADTQAPHSRKKTPAPPVELSLCMIVRNEEPRIGQCLQSIAPYVDEMVVVDTGSTDRTREIARDCGARVFDFPWTDSFSEARNQSLAQARGQWIFWMDADDVISPECGAQLKELIRRHPDRDVAYQVQVRIPPGPNEYSLSVVDHVKLFPNRPDIRFEFCIHEQVLSSLRRAGMDIRFSDLYVTHANYDRSDAGQKLKRLRDFRLLQRDIREHPNHPFVLFNLGMTYLYAVKEFEVAAHYLRRSLDASHWQDSIVRKAYALLTSARICQQDWEQAAAANEEGRTYYPDDAELLFQAGQIYQQVGRHPLAFEALDRLVREQETSPHYRSVDAGLRTFRGRHEMGLLFLRLGDPVQGERWLRECLAMQPDYLPARKDLADLLQSLGRTEEARKEFS